MILDLVYVFRFYLSIVKFRESFKVDLGLFLQRFQCNGLGVRQIFGFFLKAFNIDFSNKDRDVRLVQVLWQLGGFQLGVFQRSS